MHRLGLILMLATVAAPVEARTVKAPEQSWGKPGVSPEHYRTDSLECGRAGYYRDIADTDQAKQFAATSQQIDTLVLSGSDPELIVNEVERRTEAMQPVRRIAELRTLLQSTVERCLTARGYRRFRLTKGQRKRVAHMKIGSDVRRAYLHSLASDPAVLDAQAP